MISGRNRKTVRIGKWNVRFSDLAFLAVLCVLAVYFFANLPYGITEVDESVYHYYCYRLVSGDKLLADDWNFSNLFSVFTYLPYRVLFSAFGSTQGILMAFRGLHAVMKLVFFALIYISLRSYGFWSILAGAIFVGTDIFGIKTASYYTVCLFACMLTGLLLFTKPSPGPRRMILAGFFFGCAVIAEPVAALLWGVYGLLTLISLICGKRGKTVLAAYDFILSARVWFFTFIGICIGAVLFLLSCALFFTGTDLQAILTGVVQMLQSASLDPVNGISVAAIRLGKVYTYAYFYNRVLSVLFVLVFAAGVVFHRFTVRFEKPAFVLLSLLFAAMSVCLLLTPAGLTGAAAGECCSHPLLLTLLAWAAYVFTPQKNRKMFAFLLFSAGIGFAVDCSSNVTFGCMQLIGSVPAVILLRDYFCAQFPGTERKQPEKSRKSAVRPVREPRAKSAFIAVLCGVIVFIPVYETAHYIVMARLHETEDILVGTGEPLDTEIPEGALKGVITTRTLAENYEKSLRDARRISQLCKSGCCVLDFAPSVYLDAQVPVSEPWLHFFTDDWQGEELWWDVHPGRFPDVFYIPYETLCYLPFDDDSHEEKLSYLKSVADVSVEEGEAGYIVTVGQRIR